MFSVLLRHLTTSSWHMAQYRVFPCWLFLHHTDVEHSCSQLAKQSPGTQLPQCRTIKGVFLNASAWESPLAQCRLMQRPSYPAHYPVSGPTTSAHPKHAGRILVNKEEESDAKSPDCSGCLLCPTPVSSNDNPCVVCGIVE